MPTCIVFKSFSYVWTYAPTFKHIFPSRNINIVIMSFGRYGEKLPCVDIFVCTADPHSEPPSLVMSTTLSLMAYDYPTEKLSVYLSDDGGSVLTFYAMWEASSFAKHWIPFCKRYNIEPRSPAAYFSESDGRQDLCTPKEWSLIKVRRYSKHIFLTPEIKCLLHSEWIGTCG
jgi:hypothetical protein